MKSHPRHLPADERRAVTVEAVVELAADQNPSEITTTAIAKHMGLTQGALFRHFPTKDSILEAVMEWVAERLLSRVDRAIEAAPSPVAAIEAVFAAHVAFVADHPGVPRMLFGELQRAEQTAPKRIAQTIMRRLRSRLARLIEDGKSAGELLPTLDADVAVTCLIGMVQGLVMQSLLVNDVGRIRREAPRVFAIYLRGIGSQP
jgi:AcrR family transcriptional regulator